MINNKFIYSITLLLAFGVSVSEQEDENKISLVRGRYSFNHPPNVEDYNPLFDVEENNRKDQSTNVLKKVGIVTRSSKGLISDDEPKDTLTSSKYEDVTERNKKIEHSLGFEHIPITVVYESDNTQDRNTFEKTTRKSVNKPQTPRRRLRQKHKGKKNETNPLNNETPRKLTTTENAVYKPTLETTKAEDKARVVKFEEQSTTKAPKTSRRRKPVIPIIENENFVYSHTGDFHYSYESGDGTKAFERGELKTFEDKTAGEAVFGSFSYTDKEGNDFSLSYTADENGYRPEGIHLPTPPPIPPEIARALLYLSTKSTPGPATESYD